MNLDELKYPIGKVEFLTSYSPEKIQLYIRNIENLPNDYSKVIQNIWDRRENQPYRPGGWTAKQVVHHVADSHLNLYIRFKLALTEDNPTIKPYNENAWAELIDYELPTQSSLQILQGVHTHWVALMKNMTEEDWHRTFFHPEHQKSQALYEVLSYYDWHGRHHLAQIKSIK